MSRPSIRTEPLGGSTLSVAARAGRLPQWYAPLPHRGGEWPSYARDVVGSIPSDWLESLAPAFTAGGPAARRLAASGSGRGIVVTTGQQPGLFGGPIMTLAKAITARAIADAIADVAGVPVAPVFWAATDDADFDEAAGISVPTDTGCEELRLGEKPSAGVPMALAALDASIGRLVERLRAACGSCPHGSYLDAAAREYLRPGATIGSAYVAMLRAVLEPLEIAVLDVSHAAVSARARPFLASAARSAESVAHAVRTRSDAIREAGFDPQVEEVPGLSLVSINEGGVKRRLPIAEAMRIAAAQNPSLSSTVLLRPVMERAILPTAVYVGGPGEVAYFAQVTAVAEALGAATPRVAPRWSTTIVEPRIQRILEGLGLGVDDFADPNRAESRVARQRMSPKVEAALGVLRTGLRRGLDELQSADGNVLPARALEGARRGFEHRLQRLERRVVAAIKHHESAVMRDVTTARGSLYPNGIRQERQLAFIPYLAKHGPELLEEMLVAARAHASEIVGEASTRPHPSAAATASI